MKIKKYYIIIIYQFLHVYFLFFLNLVFVGNYGKLRMN